MKSYDVVVIGGGAAGFFTAINVAFLNPNLSVVILERAKNVLQKVRISGGGRCNVTHAEFIPNELAKNYPRGEKELRGPFHSFMTGDTMEWFEQRGVPLKIEDDGRIFPASNSSASIIDCFLAEAHKLGIEIQKQQLVTNFKPITAGWEIATKTVKIYAKKLVVATGSQTKIWKHLSGLGVKTIPPVPSLFTFNSNDHRIASIPGVAVQVSASVNTTKLKTEGPLLITHWGFSGPAILKLSAWGARTLHELDYQFDLLVNWTKFESFESCHPFLKEVKEDNPKQLVVKKPLYELPKRLWVQLVLASGIFENQRWADVNKKQLTALTNQLVRATFLINGKSAFKDEFVTAGGVDLKEINFKNYQCNKLQNCYLVGEVLNVDAITGGFNFQNAWTGGYIAAHSIVKELS
ncbi:NAD(P)/FAD-dependent oxidoreductase [Aquimarina agarivorans]|uniref:NAD(P)/FAD-dependent oxidoreductase n=1 Tax=Aquimarina agarivorans TaxID=980584 RepID=UPI000248E6E6|nr:NAD(P)/FAD-dependent oxidoreductase [Aquimarina agarivorans]